MCDCFLSDLFFLTTCSAAKKREVCFLIEKLSSNIMSTNSTVTLIETLPDGVLSHIVSFIISELRKLPLVCVRFREICMMPHWYTKFILQLNPAKFINDDNAINNNPLSFQFGNNNEIIIENPSLFLNLADKISLPWQHFSVFDLYLNPEIIKYDALFTKCIEMILPYFGSCEISPATKQQKDILYLNNDLFSNKKYDSIYHLSLNGTLEWKQNEENDINKPGLNNIFINIFNNIQYLELNFISYPDIDWINLAVSELKELVILDLWKCEWKEHSLLRLNDNIELFRVFNCTLNTNFDFKQCNKIRVISTNCKHLLSNNLLSEISYLLTKYENNENFEIILSHIRSSKIAINTLKKMVLFNIDKVNIIYTRDMYKIFDELQNKINKLLMENDDEFDDYQDLDNDDFHEIQYQQSQERKHKKNKKINILQQKISLNDFPSDEDEQDHDQYDQYEDNKQITIFYEKLNINLFAASNNYSLFRKLLKIGRLRGTFVWQQ